MWSAKKCIFKVHEFIATWTRLRRRAEYSSRPSALRISGQVARFSAFPFSFYTFKMVGRYDSLTESFLSANISEIAVVKHSAKSALAFEIYLLQFTVNIFWDSTCDDCYVNWNITLLKQNMFWFTATIIFRQLFNKMYLSRR